VEFKLPRKAESDGWIIQQVSRSYDIRKRDGSVADPKLNAPKAVFWEAWPVKKGATLTANRYDATADGRTYDDSFDRSIYHPQSEPRRGDAGDYSPVKPGRSVREMCRGPLAGSVGVCADVLLRPATKTSTRGRRCRLEARATTALRSRRKSTSISFPHGSSAA
jgi:hypothetical protein